MEFYVSIKGEKTGPFSHYQINGMLRSGEIDGDSLVWTRGQGTWEKLRGTPALQSSLDIEFEKEVSDEEGETETSDSITELTGNRPPLPNTRNIPKKTVPVAYEVRPLTRFWARSFDYLMVTVFVWSISDITPPEALTGSNLTFGDLVTQYAEELQKEEWQRFAKMVFYSQVIWHFIEGLLIHMFGTTPGKALFGIKIKRIDGRPPAILPSIARSFYVYFAGLAMYFFPFSIICMAIGFFRLMTTGKTFWDDHLKMEVEHPPMGILRIFLAIGAFLVLMIVHSLKFS